VNCETSTLQECLWRIQERAAQTPPEAWIVGHGWNQNDWAEGFGDTTDLDAVAPDHPVHLTAKSLHAGWANSLALRRAHINNDTPDPEGGHIQRAPDGTPTGILFEAAMDLVSSVMPAPNAEAITKAIEDAIPSLWALGLTGIHDFDRRPCFTALQTLHEQGKLGLRVVKSIPLEDIGHALAVGLRTGFGDRFLRIGSVKVFADGALGPRTAAMLEPYQGDRENQGILLHDSESLFEHARKATAGGFTMAVHAIGDRANHEVLNAFAQLRSYEREHRLPLRRHRIEHVQILHQEDLGRLAELGVIASMQPIHAISDMNAADRYWGSRAALAYAWRDLQNRDTRMAFGSDAPVDSPNPFWGIHAAVTRRRADGSPAREGWYPEQRLDILSALHGYTTGAAYAAGSESHSGMLEPGFLADLLILDMDPFRCRPDQLREIRPMATMVAGEWVRGGPP
jgi:predicted amidohydrolase YtcJ